MLFNQNAYSQFGSNYAPQGGTAANPEDGFGGARASQGPYQPPMPASGSMGFGSQPTSQATPQQPSSGTSSAPQPRPSYPPPSPTSSLPTTGMTWTQMQQQGYARPPFPGITPGVEYPMGMNPAMAPGVQYPISRTGQPHGPNPAIAPGVEYPVGGPTGPASVTGPQSLEQRLTAAYQQYQGLPSFQNPVAGAGIDSTLQGNVQSLLNQPSPYLTPAFQSQLQQTMGQIDDQYNQADLALHQNIASRGLDTAGTIGASDQRYNNLLRRTAKGDAANNLLNQLAQTYGADRANAIQAAMGYTGQQYGQAQNTYATNQAANAQNFGQQNTALQNLLNYGQQSFNNQLQTSAFNANQDQQNTALLLQLLGAGY